MRHPAEWYVDGALVPLRPLEARSWEVHEHRCISGISRQPLPGQTATLLPLTAICIALLDGRTLPDMHASDACLKVLRALRGAFNDFFCLLLFVGAGVFFAPVGLTRVERWIVLVCALQVCMFVQTFFWQADCFMVPQPAGRH